MKSIATLLTLSLFAGCQTLQDLGLDSWRPTEQRDPLVSIRDAEPAHDLVLIGITSAEQSAAVVISGSLQPQIRFERSGGMVHASDGRLAHRIRVAPSQRHGLLGYGDRQFPGELIVSAHPDGGLRLMNEVALETYVEGVVASELILWSAKPAEIEAQAIAARTYALHSLELRGTGGFLWDSTVDQAYRGQILFEGSRSAERVRDLLHDALAATTGRVLVQHGQLLDARFHASCGGRTSNLHDVFPKAGYGPFAVECEPCLKRGLEELRFGEPDLERPLAWNWTASASELAHLAADLGIGWRVEQLRPLRRDASGRWIAVELVGSRGRKQLGFSELRRRLGEGQLKSASLVRTWPRAQEPIEAGFYFEGRGRGHGVGLCQEGCHDYAAQGWSAERILAHYYADAQVLTLDEYSGMGNGARR
jgi:stage II sporulation protein D